MKNDTPTEGQYAGDLVSNAGKREMGPKCGSLPRNAGELAGLVVLIVKCRVGHLFARMSHSIPRAVLASWFSTVPTIVQPACPCYPWIDGLNHSKQTQTYCLLLRADPLPINVYKK